MVSRIKALEDLLNVVSQMLNAHSLPLQALQMISPRAKTANNSTTRDCCIKMLNELKKEVMYEHPLRDIWITKCSQLGNAVNRLDIAQICHNTSKRHEDSSQEMIWSLTSCLLNEHPSPISPDSLHVMRSYVNISCALFVFQGPRSAGEIRTR